MKILFLVKPMGKILPCFSQLLLGVPWASGCSFPWDAFGPHIEGTDKCRAFFWLRKNFLTAAYFRATVTSDLWRLSSCFIWTIFIAEGFFFFFFFFYSTFTFDLTVTLCNLGWSSGRPSKISHFSPNWQNTLTKAQAVSFEHFYFQYTNYWIRKLFRSTNLSQPSPAMLS